MSFSKKLYFIGLVQEQTRCNNGSSQDETAEMFGQSIELMGALASAMRDLSSPKLSSGVTLCLQGPVGTWQGVWGRRGGSSASIGPGRVKHPPETCVHAPTHARLTLTARAEM